MSRFRRCAELHDLAAERVKAVNMRDWHLDIDAWSGPDRKKWPGLRDIVQESPDGRHVAVVYSCGEIDIYKEVGRFALLAGPPESPRLHSARQQAGQRQGDRDRPRLASDGVAGHARPTFPDVARLAIGKTKMLALGIDAHLPIGRGPLPGKEDIPVVAVPNALAIRHRDPMAPA